ncbi:MAG: asparagine synthase C-terminal domain-containing protein, partial [Cyanobacteriota bacterium]
VSVSPNFAAIDQYLTYQYVPSPLTAFTGIFKLPPAHFLICQANGTLDIQRYWSPPLLEKTKASPPEIEEELLRQLKEAVRLRMISDVPLGAFLSGGIDSATVVALMAQESAKPVKTFSIGFEEEEYNELPYAKLIAERYQTEHHEFLVKPVAAEILPLLVRHYGEPFADSSALPTYYVSQMTRQHVTVALSGDGGDENFSGYDHYRQLSQWTAVDVIPKQARKAVTAGMEMILDRLPYHEATAKLSKALFMLGTQLPERYNQQLSILKRQEQRACYSSYFQSLLQGMETPDLLAGLPWDDSMDALDWMMRHDQNFHLPDCWMVKVDIASMANSLEVRCPFMDHKLIEFTATIPSSLKRNSTGGKLILKNVIKELLPPQVLNKRKTGFGVPLAKWFRGELADSLKAMLVDATAQNRGLFEQRFMNKMVDEQLSGQRDWSNRLWAFLCLEMWFREFID